MSTSTLSASIFNPISNNGPTYKPLQADDAAGHADIVSRAQGGDQEAFSALYKQHKKHVFSICIRMVRDFSLAEDLTQDTFMQVHRKLTSFRGDSGFGTWLHRLAVNTVLMHLRKRALTLVSLDHLMDNVHEERAGRRFGTRDLSQAGAVDRLTINRAVATMAPGYRSVFLLHDVQGFDHGEIASMLKCSSGTTKSQLHKARRVLRGALTTQTGFSFTESSCHDKASLTSNFRIGNTPRKTRSKGAPVTGSQSTVSALAT